jgi:hypothetical protein
VNAKKLTPGQKRDANFVIYHPDMTERAEFSILDAWAKMRLVATHDAF